VALGFVLLIFGLVAACAAFFWVLASLTPQDSGIEANGDWGYGILPAALGIACFMSGIQLLKSRN
jgi:hypothetical protein